MVLHHGPCRDEGPGCPWESIKEAEKGERKNRIKDK